MTDMPVNGLIGDLIGDVPMNDLIVLTVAVPLLMAFLLPSLSRASFTLSRLVAPVVIAALIFIPVCIWALGQQPYSINLGLFAAPVGISFYVDSLSLLFVSAILFVPLVLWPWYFDADESIDTSTRRISLTLLIIAAACGIALSADLFNLYVFYELLAVASYGLVAGGNLRPNGSSFAAAFRYLIISAFGSVLALLAIGIIYFQAGTLNLAHLAQLQLSITDPLNLVALTMLIIGFGVKAEIFPLNSWVPEVYMGTSRRIAGLLAGLVSKIAVLIILKIVLLVYPHDESRQLLLLLGLLSVIIGEFAAMRATDLIRMLSWSSIAQLGLVFIAFSLPGKAGLIAGLALMLHHMIVKPGLFLIAEKWGGNITGLSGAAVNSPLMAVFFVIFALSMVGVPPLPGFWAKFLLLTGLSEHQSYIAIAIVLIMTIIETNYLFRVVTRLYEKTEGVSGFAAFRAGDKFSTTILAGLLLLVTINISVVSDQLEGIAVEATDTIKQVETILPVSSGLSKASLSTGPLSGGSL